MRFTGVASGAGAASRSGAEDWHETIAVNAATVQVVRAIRKTADAFVLMSSPGVSGYRSRGLGY
jgi:hypothetical protein